LLMPANISSRDSGEPEGSTGSRNNITDAAENRCRQTLVGSGLTMNERTAPPKDKAGGQARRQENVLV